MMQAWAVEVLGVVLEVTAGLKLRKFVTEDGLIRMHGPLIQCR
jgi:hypothetical protein